MEETPDDPRERFLRNAAKRVMDRFSVLLYIGLVPRKVFITVAERSADQHAANLVREMRAKDPSIEFHALGGEHLRAAGAIVHHDTVSNAAMGLAAFKRYFEVKSLLRFTESFYREQKPDLHICCDSWTMNVHFARLAKSFGTKVFYYIAPQVWASREKRVVELARLADRVACILSFEEEFLRGRGVNATFVGHPLFDEMRKVRMKDEGGRMNENELGCHVSSSIPFSPTSSFIPHPSSLLTIGLPCGSRRGFVVKNLPRQIAVAKKIRAIFPDAKFLIPTTPATSSVVAPMIAGLDFITAEEDAFDRQMRRCDFAISVSGTATLHVAAHRVPMIVVYYGHPLVWHLAGRWLIKTRTFSMVNLLANNGKSEPAKHIVPEFVPWNGPVDTVANLAIDYLEHPEKLTAQRAKIDEMLARSARPGASVNAAKIAMELLDSSQKR